MLLLEENHGDEVKVIPPALPCPVPWLNWNVLGIRGEMRKLECWGNVKHEGVMAGSDTSCWC
jgi:hypothetical protein